MAELVGILNMTPDSFSDGGRNNSAEAAVGHAREMLEAGAAIIDVGAESTRPGAGPITWREEVGRLDVFMGRVKLLDWRISLDTYHPETVDWASKILGRFIINDVTGFRDPAMREVAARTGNQVVVGHLPMVSRDIQTTHRAKPVDSIEQVVDELGVAVERLVEAGVGREKIIVDPGIGFGKNPDLNWELLRFGLHMPEHEVMVGYSRKRFLGKQRLEIETNRSAGRIAVDAGAKYLRVHDIAGHASLA